MRALVAAAVGAPFTWAEVEYRAPWAGGLSVESRTSLSLIAQSLENRDGRPGVVVFALDTVAAFNRLDRSGRPIPGTQCLPDPLEDLPEGLLGPREYGGFTGKISSCMGEWFRDNAGLDVEVRVAPGFGESVYTREDGSRATARWEISQGLLRKGVDAMGYTASLMTLGLLAAMEERLGGGPGELHVDLTHGVNYATTAFYRASLLAARLYAVAHDARVDVTFYNSEPYVPGARRLNVWIVRSETVTPKVAASRLAYTAAAAAARTGKFGVAPSELAPAAREEVKRALSESLQSALGSLAGTLNGPGRIAAASIVFGLPLLLLQAGAEARSSPLKGVGLGALAGRVLGSVPHVNVEKSSDSVITVTHEVALDPWQVRLLLALAAFALYSANALESCKCSVERRTSTLKRNQNCARAEADVVIVSIDDLKWVTSRYIPGFLAPVMVESEVSAFEAALEGQVDGERWVPVTLIPCRSKGREKAEDYNAKSRVLNKGLSDDDVRNFAAHAGLARYAVTVEADCGGVGPWSSRTRFYYDPCLLDRVGETASRLLAAMAGELTP